MKEEKAVVYDGPERRVNVADVRFPIQPDRRGAGLEFRSGPTKAIEIPVEILASEGALTEKAKAAEPTAQVATIAATEVERIEAAVRELAKDPHAPREVTVKATLHVHHDYPKVLYKGKESRSVADAEAEAAAQKDGFGDYDHEAFTAPAGVKVKEAPQLYVKEPPDEPAPATAPKPAKPAAGQEA